MIATPYYNYYNDHMNDTETSKDDRNGSRVPGFQAEADTELQTTPLENATSHSHLHVSPHFKM